jgi:hypothetical protein
MHGTTADFWKEYRALPADIRERADKQFASRTVDHSPNRFVRSSHHSRSRARQRRLSTGWAISGLASSTFCMDWIISFLFSGCC